MKVGRKDRKRTGSVISFFLFFKINLFIYLFLAVLGLHCCTRLSLVGLVGAILCCSGFSCCRAQALGVQASVVVAHGLSSCGSWALECRLSSCGAGA